MKVNGKKKMPVTKDGLRDYVKEQEAVNAKTALIRAEEKNDKGHSYRALLDVAMLILNANNESVRVLQKERDDWYKAWANRGELLENAQKMVDIQTGLSNTGLEKQNEIKREHQLEIRKYLEVLTLLKRFPDKLKELLEKDENDANIVAEMVVISESMKNQKKSK